MDLGTIGKKFKKIGRDTVTEVQKMNDIRQINSKIHEQKKQIAEIHSQIGQKLYKLYKEAPLEGFDTEFQKIDERLATIEVYNSQLREIKGVRVCPNCHAEVSLKEKYCSACGQKLPEVLHVQKDEDGNTVLEGMDAETADEPKQETPEAAAEPAAESGENKAAAADAEPEKTAETEAAKPEASEPAKEQAGEAKAAETVKEPTAEPAAESGENETAAADAEPAKASEPVKEPAGEAKAEEPEPAPETEKTAADGDGQQA